MMKEIINLRRPREKYFKKENGIIDACLYDYDVHYQKDGKYYNIDNTWMEEENTYHNKSNSYQVTLQKEKKEELVKINNGIAELMLSLPNTEVQTTSSLKNQVVYYENILHNIDIKYEFIKNKLKDTIILKEIENDFDHLNFKIHNLNAKLENNQIILEKNNQFFAKLEAPTLTDNQNNSYPINYILDKNPEGSIIRFEIQQDILNQANLYPLTIDPILTQDEKENVTDTYIYSGDENINRNNTDILKVGVDQNHKVYRTLLKFELPNIGTGCDIIGAQATLISHESDYEFMEGYKKKQLLTAHEMTMDWNEETATWNNYHDKYDEKIEDYFEPNRSMMTGSYPNWKVELKETSFDITNLVKKWYAGYPNYGLLLKAMNEVYEAEVPEHSFYSKNNTITETANPKPFLIVSYRNLNGLEDYMTYQNVSYQDGTTFINNLTGNITSVFHLNKTIGGNIPLELNLIYNTNDVVLQNDYGYGLGYKLNYHQTLEEIQIDNQNYLEYVDEDGTKHYFYQEEEMYFDEDGLNLTVTKEENNYIIKDKSQNQMIFTKINNLYYLHQIKNVTNDVITIQYTNQKITKITDSLNQSITISYNNNGITTNSPYTASLITLNNNQMVRFVTKNGITLLEYQNNLLTKVKDVNQKSIAFTYYDTKPYRLKKMTELGISGTIGNYLEFKYGFQVTRITDAKGRVNTYSFNKQGNTIGVTNLKSSDDFVDSIGNYQIYDDINAASKNKLLLDSGSMKYTNNLAMGRQKTITGSGNISLTDIKASGEYTLSALFQTNQDDVILQLQKQTIPVKNLPIFKTEEYQRYSMTFELEGEINQYTLKVIATNPETITHIQELQIEKGSIPNYYNLIVNSDFSQGLTGWVKEPATDTDGNELPNDDEVITLPNKEKAYHRKSYYNQSKAVSQIIPINGKKNDTYRLSFWYKNNGIRENGMFAGHIITLGFDYINGDVEHGTQMHNLNIHGTEWQFFNMTFIAESDYDKVWIHIISQTEVNDLYFTHLTLTKDIGNNSYNYDESGNLISATDQSKQKQTFHYDKNNQLISSFEPKGNHFKFEYDNLTGSLLLQGISTKGIANKISYDDHNNPIKTVIQNKRVSELENHSFYLRKKGTNLYITPKAYQNTLVLAYPLCYKESFTFTKTGDYYTLKNTTSNKFISVVNNELTLADIVGQAFELIPNENGSYTLKHPEANMVVTAIGNYLELKAFVPEDANQQFYFEPINQEQYVETSAEYTSDGKFITKTIDSLGKFTTYDIDTTTGLTNSMTNAQNQTTTYTYNSKEQITKVKKEDREINYQYNNQNLLSKILCDNKEYNFIYDEFLNAKNVKINNTTLVTNEYEPNNGNLSKVTYGNNASISYTYDEMDRVKTLQKDKTYHHYYNNQNELVRIEAPNEIYNYAYDFAGRVKKYFLNEDSIEYDYDINSNVLSKKFVKDKKEYQIHYTYDEDDSIIKVTFDNQSLNYIYDDLGRLIKKNINNQLPIEYEFYSNGNKTSFMLKSMKIDNDIYEYTYDNLYNIKTIRKNKELIHEYFYDNFNELVRENNYLQNKTYKYVYDTSGNILFKNQYELKTDNLLHQDTYEYQNENWKDQLTKFNDIPVTYDAIGNPLTIGNMNLTWQNGRELKKITTPTNTINYTYNKDGIRKSKTVNNITTNYFTENNALIFEETNNNMLYFIRDDNNNLIGFNYNNGIYYYQKNLFGDITGIYNGKYVLIATYEYDSWGNILSIKDNGGNDIRNQASHIANINPFRYRSYYYDRETNLYYLNSRYYNPEWGRFINADGIIGSSNDYIGYNLFNYANNNPITNVDATGRFFIKAIKSLVNKGVKTTKKMVQVGLAGLAKLGGDIMKMPLAGDLFAKSFISSKSPLPNRVKHNIINKVKKSPEFQKAIATAIVNTNDKEISTIVSTDFIDKDLHNALGKVKIELNGENQGPYWEINVKVSDIYDFDERDWNLNFSSIMNNVGYELQENKMLETYAWDVQFSVKAPSKRGSF